ncbi:hypothetical protein [Streptomyces sp. NPDC014623]|uniref:hypothetical protein n=1 Tax=Streptomyces sp. NPDC014623 TaxID=3364875 RepID=UPI0036FFE64E
MRIRVHGKNARPLAGFFTAAVLAVGAALVTASPAAAACSECPSGRACYFVDSDGTGDFDHPTACGNFHLRSYAGRISSVKTHGNAVQLRDVNQNPVGYVGPWTSTNLSRAENDKAHWFAVIC